MGGGRALPIRRPETVPPSARTNADESMAAMAMVTLPSSIPLVFEIMAVGLCGARKRLADVLHFVGETIKMGGSKLLGRNARSST